MGLYIERLPVSWRQQLWAATLVWCWPWQVYGVRQLLTNPDVTEITVRKGDRITTFCFNPPPGYRRWHQLKQNPWVRDNSWSWQNRAS